MIYLRRTARYIFAAAYGGTQDGAVADRTHKRRRRWKRRGNGLCREIARYKLRRIAGSACGTGHGDGVVEPDLILVVLHQGQMVLSTCCRRCEGGADGGHVG